MPERHLYFVNQIIHQSKDSGDSANEKVFI